MNFKLSKMKQTKKDLTQIQSELKIIREFEYHQKKFNNINHNGLEENSYKINADKHFDKCLIIDSSIEDLKTLKAVKMKLLSRRNYLNRTLKKTFISGWVADLEIKEKWNKMLDSVSSKKGNAANEFIRNYKI